MKLYETKSCNYLLLIYSLLVFLQINCYEEKTEECPLLPAAYVEIYSQVREAKKLILAMLSQYSNNRDPEQIRRSVKQLLLAKQNEILNNLNTQFNSGYMDQNIYYGLYNYIFNTFAQLSGIILQNEELK